jgi:hypothetical protein
VNERSFIYHPCPWFLIKGRTEDDVANAHRYILTISEEAEKRNPRWSITEVVEHLTDKDLDNIDKFYKAIDVKSKWTEHLLGQEFILANEREMDHVSTFNAALTDFEINIVGREIKREQELEMIYHRSFTCFGRLENTALIQRQREKLVQRLRVNMMHTNPVVQERAQRTLNTPSEFVLALNASIAFDRSNGIY